MEAEMRAAAEPSASAPSLADAARELLSGAGGAPSASAGSASDAGGKGTAGVTNMVWEKAGTVAQTSLWAATFGQGLGGVVRTAEELEKLTKPLGGLTVVGCAFSLVALSARAVSLMGMERQGRGKLVQAQEDLRGASVSLVDWLCSILNSGFNDDDGLVGRVFDILGECLDGADELEQYLVQRLPMRTWDAEDVVAIVAKVKTVRDKLFDACLLKVVAEQGCLIADNRFDVKVLQSQTALKDEFSPYAPDPSAFDFGLVANAATSLAQLKAAVLPAEPAEGSTGVGVVNSIASGSSSSLRRVALTSINGEGGVGKTSTCKLLCSDTEVRDHFVDGAIIWIDVGQGATEQKVKDEIRSAVSLCGGHQTGKDIALSVTVSEAVKMASSFFSGYRILAVLDNVWETPAGFRVHGWAATLAEIATSPGSAVIVTTRFLSVSRSRGFGSIDLGRYDLTTTTEGGQGWLAAEHLYDSLLEATLEEQSGDANKKERQEVLEISCGLPIVISTFVCLVRIRRRRDGSVGNVLVKIRRNVSVLVGRSAGVKVKTMTCHPGLLAVMEEGLAHLDEHAVFDAKAMSLNLPKDNDSRVFRAEYCDKSGKQLSSRYAALGLMSKSSTRLSFPVLRHVWHVEEADEIAELFENIGLGRIEEGSNGQDDVFILHDLQYEYCASMSTSHPRTAADIVASMPGSASGHARFLSSCESLLLNALTAGGDVCQGWARFCFAEGPGLSEVPLRQYLARNLLRHLCGAADQVGDDGAKRTVMGVLSDFVWLRGRVAGDGRSSAIRDCTTALASRSCTSASSGAETRLLTGGAQKSVRALQQRLMLVREGVSLESDGTLAGALVQLSQSSIGSGIGGMDAGFFEKLACSSESGVRGPWFRPISGCSRLREQGVLARPGREAANAPELEAVTTVTVVPAAGLVVSGHGDGRLSLWRAESGEFVRAFGDEKGNKVTCVDFCAGEYLAVSGHVNGVALVWDASTWNCRFALEWHSKKYDYVACVTISEDAKRIVTVDWGGDLRLWDAQIGGAALQTIETGLRCSVFGSRSAISPDGGHFLWASRDCSSLMQKWRCEMINFGRGSVIWKEDRHFALFHGDAVLKEMMSSEAFGGENVSSLKEVPWKFGAVDGSRSVHLRDSDSGQQSADWFWISSGSEYERLPRIDCEVRTGPAAASLGLNSVVSSIAAEWMPRETGGRQRALVACLLHGKRRPAIMHFYPAKE